MKFDLAALARRIRKPRRHTVTLPVIRPSAVARDDLAAIYLSMLRAIRDRVKTRILPAYERSLARSTRPGDSLTRDDVSEVQGEMDGLDAEVRRLVLTLTPEMRRWVIKAEQTYRSKFVAAAYTATGVDLETVIGASDVEQTLAAFLASNSALVRDVGLQAENRIADSVFRGYQQRTSVRDVAREIDDALGLGRGRAVRIARDQSQRLSAALDQERQRQSGITSWVWTHGGSLHPREEHLALDGEVFTWADPPEDLPGELWNCSCRAAAMLTFEENAPADQSETEDA